MFFRYLITLFLLLYGGAGSKGGSNACSINSVGPPVLDRPLVVLFTSDLHSVVMPQKDGTGGYAAIAAIIEQERANAMAQEAAFLLLDGGDISMGTIFHSAFEEQAIELRSMAMMGYDAVALGNHDFDFGISALNGMVRMACTKEPHLACPKLLMANLHFSWDTTMAIKLQPYELFERNGIKVGVVGVMGKNSYNVIADGSGQLLFTDAAEAAGKAVAELREAGADYVVILSHGGTLNGDDISLAERVEGADFIVSAHDHVALHEAMRVGNTYIGAAGAYGEYVGKAVFRNGQLESYSLIEAVGDGGSNGKMKHWTDSVYMTLNKSFAGVWGMQLTDTVTFLEYDMPKQVSEDGKMELGNIIAGSYRNVLLANVPEARETDAIGVVPYGIVRKGLEKGAVTVADIFGVLPLGENENGYTGYPLVYAWLTGKEVKDLCEMTESVSPYLEDTRLFLSGVQYTCRTLGLPFFKVRDVAVNGLPLQEDKLYMIVADKYTAQLIGLLEKESFGLLKAVPKSADGKVVNPEDLPVVRDAHGRAITGWLAFALYMNN